MDIPRINLTEPSASLERLADGQANFGQPTFDPKDPNAEPSAWTVDIGAIGFDKGHVTLVMEPENQHLDVLIDSLERSVPARSSAKQTRKGSGEGQQATGLCLHFP